MRRPSLFDLIIGHPLILLAECGLGLDLAVRYLGGQQVSLAPALFVVVPFAISTAARSRILAWREHQREWQAMSEKPPRRVSSSLRRYAVLMCVFLFAPFAVDFGWHFLTGWMEGSGRVLPPLRTLAPAILLDYPALLLGYVATLWLRFQENPGIAVIVAMAMALLYGAVRLLSRWLRRPHRAVPSKGRSEWDGIVQIVLPIPDRSD